MGMATKAARRYLVKVLPRCTFSWRGKCLSKSQLFECPHSAVAMTMRAAIWGHGAGNQQLGR
eukprot:5437177-Karenia_brevis.AAC.1